MRAESQSPAELAFPRLPAVAIPSRSRPMLVIQGGAIEGLPADAREVLLGRCVAVTSCDIPLLVERIDTYLEQVREATARNEFLNLALAERLASVLKTLLGEYDHLGSAYHQALVVGACRFFLETNDVWGDLDSPLGFDDDAEVLNAVLRDIGREDLLVEIR